LAKTKRCYPPCGKWDNGQMARKIDGTLIERKCVQWKSRRRNRYEFGW